MIQLLTMNVELWLKKSTGLFVFLVLALCHSSAQSKTKLEDEFERAIVTYDRSQVEACSKKSDPLTVAEVTELSHTAGDMIEYNRSLEFSPQDVGGLLLGGMGIGFSAGISALVYFNLKIQKELAAVDSPFSAQTLYKVCAGWGALSSILYLSSWFGPRSRLRKATAIKTIVDKVLNQKKALIK